ncbi:hypothetical protein PRIPAC_75480 [Pristionchus pacificus]|uniref:Uncharacterized protein n=1 Tax=Pristionchus pacificus TaxID=54126 RepID=A0A2A6BRI9_PRIPA|nr:hypothetical protein PRIPAC_75480 [Pristionchus pacificus]|eukprot:PDM68572.1 hypothetical protein PRIPAC_44074 [Pristionchus pacificus]
MGSDADDLNGSDLENDDEVMEEGGLAFQKTVWTLQKLPYAAEIEAQADEHFRVIKAGFAHSVLLKDIRRGMLHYCTELDKYISLHSYRFTKEDHVALLRLLTPFVKKGEIYRDVRVILRTMTALLKKKDCLSRNDITFDWRPVYDLYEEVAYGNLEEDGVFLMPEGFKDDITKFIRVAREFWPLEATQELLDEFRPLMCPWDESMLKGMKLLQMFLPTVMTREEHATFGAGLWFEEMWHHFLSIQSNSLVEPYQVHLFTRVSRDCPGLIDWSGNLNLMFAKLMRSLRLGRGHGFNQSFPVQNATVWVVYMIGVEKEAQSYLTRLMTLIESFLHPSNYGNHSSHLLNLLYRLVNEMVSRIKRERSGKPAPSVPDHLKMTEEAINEFVISLLPCVKLAIFTKVKQEYISYIIKNLALLAPKIVLPAILEILYPALETVTEPHRLTQSLSCLFVALIPMLREEAGPGERTRKAEMVVLLEALLPAIDPNDIKKTLLCFQVFGIMVNTVPLVDCSEAVHLREDLTEDEKEICSATANFDGLVLGIMDKIISLLEWGANGATSCGHGSLAKNSHNRELYELAANRLYQFVSESLYDSHVVASTVSEMISLTVRARPELSFHRFLSLISKKLQEAITPDSYEDEKVNFTITYWLSLASGLFRVQSPYILKHAEEVKAIVRLILPIKCSIGINFACKTLQRVLRSVTLCYQDADRAALAKYDLPLDENLPIRSWACRLDRKAYDTTARWFVPTTESIGFAREILDEHLSRCLEKIANPAALSKQELFHEMLVILSSVQGASFSLPAFDSPIVRVNHMPTFIEVSPVVTRPAGTPELTAPSGTVRGAVLAAMERLLPFILKERESEVKTVSAFISILSTLVFSRGSDKTKLQQIISTHRIARLMMGDRLYGTAGYIKALAEESINVAHQNRVQLVSTYHLTEEHKRIIDILAKLSTSSYAENRRPAQSVLSRVLREFPYSFTLVMDDILAMLAPGAQTPHAQLKGALYMLVDGKRLALVLRQNWEIAAKVWPALVRMQHSERPSIIRLLEIAQNTIVDSFESYRIQELRPDPAVDAAAVALLEAGRDGKHASKYGLPDDEMRAKAALYVQEQNELNQRSYDSLVQELLACAVDSSLHWRHTDLAQVFLSILIRRDAAVNPDCIRLFLRLCVHDSLKTRKMGIAYIGAWLRINKPLAEDNRGPGAQWPITYGIRKDNVCMQYDAARLPSNASEWESFPFVGKMHWAFYCWPKELKTYAFVSEQSAINRSYEELSEIERFVVDTLKDPSYSARFRELYSIEEKKGEDKFNVVTFSFFLGLFRSYNDLLLPTFVEHLEALVAKDEAGATKLATEMLAGIVNGSKMWKFEKVEGMWRWLSPFLTRVLSNLKDNAQRNWGTAIAAICGSSESRMLQPLIDLLFELTLRPSENCFMTAARLFLLQSALCQFEWRCLQLWNRLAPYLIAQLAQPYTNIRDRVVSSLVTLTWFDLPAMQNDPTVPAEFRPYTVDAVLDSFDALLNEVWEEARRGESSEGSAAPSASASSVSLCSMANGDSEGKKSGRLALKSLTQFVYTYGAQTLGETTLRILNYMPLLAHFSFDQGDDELRNGCASTLRDFLSSIFVARENAERTVELFERFLGSSYSWKVRMVLINEISTLVFSNSYAFDDHRERVGRLIASQMAHERLEVRESAAVAVSLFIHSGYLPVTEAFIKEFVTACASESLTMRHSGVLGLCSIVQAFPYSVPPFLPEILAFLCRNGREKEPIKDTIKKALAEFKRTHQDSWHEHKMLFTEDQLVLLMDFLVSPNYYV